MLHTCTRFFDSTRTRVLCISLLWSIGTSGCGAVFNKKKKSSRPGVDKTIFVHGDPRLVLAGAETNAESFLTIQNRNEFNGFQLAGGILFESLSERKAITGSAEEGNAAPTESEATAERPKYEFHEMPAGTFKYAPQGRTAAASALVFETDPESGRLNLAKFAGISVAPIHYSVHHSKKAFSVLVHGQDQESGSFLLMLTFVQPSAEEKRQKADAKFNYLLGEGVKTAWEGDIKVSLCGSEIVAPQRIDEITRSLALWTKGGKIGSRPFSVDTKSTFPPFSDLNSHCIYAIPGYLFEDSPDSAVGGITIPTLDRGLGRILDSDILISLSGIEKFRVSTGTNWTPRVVTHEFGHFLGLHHEFDRDEQGKIRDVSIMGYNDEIERTTAHDHGAIEALYGPYPTTE